MELPRWLRFLNDLQLHFLALTNHRLTVISTRQFLIAYLREEGRHQAQETGLQEQAQQQQQGFFQSFESGLLGTGL